MPTRSDQQVHRPVSLSIGELKKKAHVGCNVGWQGRHHQPHAKDALRITRHQRVRQPDHGAADRRRARAGLDAPHGGGHLLDGPDEHRGSEQPHGHGSAAGWSAPPGGAESGSSSEDDPESGAWTPPTTSDNSPCQVKPDLQALQASLASRKHLDESAHPKPGARAKVWVDFDDLVATPRWEVGTVARITGLAQNQWHQIRLHMDSRGRARTVFVRLREHPLWHRWAVLVDQRRRPTVPRGRLSGVHRPVDRQRFHDQDDSDTLLGDTGGI